MTAEHSHRLPQGKAEIPWQIFVDGPTVGIAGDDGTMVITVSRRIERESADESPDDRLSVVAVTGEIDHDTVALIHVALDQALAGRAAVCCDLSGVTFCGAAAARVLLAVHSRAVETGRIFFLRGVSGITARVLNALDPDHRIPR
ncbi:STAS domain-containing protein [Actinoplanes sp. NPDC026619]|uniref:STAS domain-containing protein n=1 Tax=Actinoplanes sp. NPDC026619 TaxID=3155798 RepID=UPI0033EC025A